MCIFTFQVRLMLWIKEPHFGNIIILLNLFICVQTQKLICPSTRVCERLVLEDDYEQIKINRCFSSGYYKRNHRLSDLNDKHLFLRVVETETSKIRVLADFVFGEDLLPGLCKAIFFQCILTWEKVKSSLCCFL